MDKKLVLLDIDDTICNASEAYEKALIKCYNFLKKKYPLISKKLFLETYKKAREQIHIELNETASMHNRLLYFQRLFEILGLSFDPVILNKITNIYWDETYKNLKLYPHVKQTLRIIKENNIKVGIVSDLIADIQIKKLIKLGISEYIDFIVTSEESGREKPHPSIFLLALEKANCLPENAIMIGDSWKDVTGAKHVGITSILFSKKDKKGADFVIDDFKNLLKILNIKNRKLSNKKMVIFDLMGSLFKEPHIIRKILFPFLLKKKIKIKYKDLKEDYIKYSSGKMTAREFYKIVPKNIEMEFLDLIKIDEKMFNLLKWLKKRGYKLGILSNLPENWGDYLVKKFGLDKYFDVIIFSGEYKSRKPKERLYDIFMSKINIKPQNCYSIDDKLVNLKEARFLLLKTIWIEREKQDILFIPDFKIKDPEQLKRIL